MNLEVEVDESQIRAVEKAASLLKDDANRRTITEAANAGLIAALKRHFAARERESHAIGWWNLGAGDFPKRYFWRGTRGTSVSERIRTALIVPSVMEATVAIDSPELAHKLAQHPPPIKPKGGRRYLAIPATPAAAQWTGQARDFPGGVRFAFTQMTGIWLPCLVAASNYRRSNGRLASGGKGGKTGANTVVYWLVKKVNTAHDPRALPTLEERREAVTKAVSAAVRGLIPPP